ncbi:phage tail tape measure protein [Peptoniphilus sp. MSJ-1]|uniref:Phage tail tape measure protein n=1 Tax=Peptoniphilus ovalis TaxID=2841503 RepID=A0ABS6FK60_9FIRM|nr:phage tail tape measure protein [Peptoniphilus ovalis]MBU5669661.1 phage tail tape measure protein [Peptoniphilus ovalis]
MSEELKLFGEVGLGYEQLLKDASQIEKILKDIDKNAKDLGESFKKNGINIDTKKSQKELEDLYRTVDRFVETNKKAGNSVDGLTKDFVDLSTVIGKNISDVDKATKTLQSIDLGADAFKVQSSEIEKAIAKQRKELTQWAKERSRLTQEFSTRDIAKMAIDDYKQTSKSGGIIDTAVSLERMQKAINVVNYDLDRNKKIIADTEIAYEKAKNKVREFVIEQKKIGKNISPDELRANINRATSLNMGLGYKEEALKGGITKVTTRYYDNAQNEIKKIYHVTTEGGIKVINAVKKTGVQAVKEVKGSLSEIKRENRLLTTQARNLDKELSKPLGDTFKGSGKALGMMLGQLFAVKQAVGYINREMMEFEKNSVEIQRITNSTKQEMEDLNKVSFDFAKNMGLNVNMIQEIEGLWARAGRSGQDLIDATKTTALGFNVAEFKDAESAVASINSIVNQMYQGDASKAPEILDALVKVADKTAVRNVNDLVEVVSRSGANAKELGMSLHDLNAVSTIVMERMKVTGDVLGTQFKTIFAYMTDGKRINKLKEYGVEFTNINKNGVESLKPFPEMMDNLVAKYKELKAQGKDVIANNMIKELSGVRHIAVLKNMMEGWNSYRPRVALSENSKGFAERQNERIMDTYAKKVEQLKVSLQEMAVAIGNSGLLDTMKSFVDTLANGSEIIGKYHKQIIAVVIAYVALKKSISGLNAIKDLAGLESLSSLLEAISKKTGAGKALSSFNDVLKKTATQTATTGGKLAGLGTSFGALKGNIATVISSLNPLTIGIVAVGAAIAGLVAYQKYQKDKRLAILDDFTSGRAKEAQDNIANLRDELNKLINSEAYKQGDTNALEDYKALTKDLADALGIEHSVIIESKSSREAYNETLKQTIALKEREYELNAKIAKNEANTEIQNKLGGSDFARENGISDAYAYVRNYMEALNKVKRLQEEIKNNPEDVGLGDKLSKASAKLSERELSLNKFIQDLAKLQAQAGLTDEELRKMLSGQDYEGTPIFDIINEMRDGFPKAKENAEGVTGSLEKMQENAEKAHEAVEALVKEFNDFDKSKSAIEGAFEEYKENGNLSDGSVIKLLDADSSMAEYLTKTKDGWVLLAGAVDHYKMVQEEATQKAEEAVNQFREQQGLITNFDGTENGLAKLADPTELQTNLSMTEAEIQTAMSNIKTTFEDGKTSVDGFVQKLKDAKTDAEFNELVVNLDTSQLEALNEGFQLDLASQLNELSAQFSSGTINADDYSRAMVDAKQRTLELYVETNNLYNSGDGVFRNQAGEVDEFASALYRSISDIDSAKTAFDSLIKLFEDTPSMASFLTGADFDVPREDIEAFAEDFTSIMSAMQTDNEELWNAIVDEVAESSGITTEQATEMLTNTQSFVENQDAVVKSAVGSTFSVLTRALSMTDAQIAKYANSILGKLQSLVNQALNAVDSISKATGGSGVNFRFGSKKIESSPFYESPIDKYNNPIMDLTNPTKILREGAGLSNFRINSAGEDNFSNYLQQKAKDYKDKKTSLQRTIDDLAKSQKELQKTTDKGQDILQQDKVPITPKTPRGGGGKGSKGKKSGSKADIPKAVEEKLEDLRHELEMKRISEEEFYKGVDKLYKANSGSMTKRGKQKFEKILADAKTKADSSIPPFVKVLIDELEDQLKYDEIDQYTYASRLDDIARKYKGQLGEKAVKELEKKISVAKVGGIDKYFKSQIGEFEDIIKLTDLAIKKIEAEQSLYEALNMGNTAGMSLQATKIDVLNNKLMATEILTKKYEVVLKAVNDEIKNLDKSSNSYQSTLSGLIEKQADFTNKLDETRIAVIELQKQRIEEQMKVYDSMQKQYDDSISVIEQMESNLVTFVNQRNQKLREQIDKNHKARMDSIDKESKARDKELNNERKRLQEALEAYRKYTQGKIDSLNKENEEEDYNRELNKKLEERNEIQNRINSLSLDDTTTARGKRIELKKQLVNKDNEIEEFQRERSRKLTQDGLNEQLKDYEETINNKMKLLDNESEHERETMDNRRKMLEDEYKREMEIMDEKMKASNVYAEVKQAILSGYVEDATGASITIRNAMIQGMEEQGKASGILREKYIRDLDEVIRKAKEAQQILGMAKSSAQSGSLQARLGLTDEGFRQYISEKTRGLGFANSNDTERYLMNKLNWETSDAAGRKRLAHENHLIRDNQMKALGADRNNPKYNRDKDGAVYGKSWVLDTGSAMKVGQSGGQFTPLGGNYGREEARNMVLADLGLYNDYSRSSSEAFFANQMNRFKNNGYSWTQPNLGGWTNQNYYDKWKRDSQTLNSFHYTSPSSRDYDNASAYIRDYRKALEDGYNNRDTDFFSGGSQNGGTNSNVENLMSKAKEQDGMPYSQSGSRLSTHRDCSSYVYFATKNAGLYSGDPFYTGNQKQALAGSGWQDLGQIPETEIRRGDILWYRQGNSGHTEIATQDGTLKTTGAHKPGTPAGPSMWSKPWYNVLRHPSLQGYRHGGIADYTGVAMLHGSKSSPEYIFNTPQFDALGRIIANYVSAPSIYGRNVYSGGSSTLPEINIDTLINIEGNADKDTVREIEHQANNILDELIIGLKKRGIRG